MWGNIICKFGVPCVLIYDKSTQFDCRDFREFIKNMDIHHKFASMAHSQTNEQTKVTNSTILNGLKKILNGAKVG